MRRRREDRGADNSVEIDLLLDKVEDIKNKLTNIETSITVIEKVLESK